MGRNMYLTQEEILAITEICSEKESVLINKEDITPIDDSPDNGLGPILRKLCRGSGNERVL